MPSGRSDLHIMMPSPNPRISRITCSADGCDMKSGTNTFSEIKMFFFPSNPIRRRTWELACRTANWKSHKNSRICCKHFVSGKPSKDPDDPDYVPSIFTFNKNAQNSKNSSLKNRRKVFAGESSRNPASSHKGINIITSCGMKGFGNKGFSTESVSSAFSQSLEPINSTLTQMMHKLTDMEEEREQLHHELARCRGDLLQLREAHQDCVTNAPTNSACSMLKRSIARPSTTSMDRTKMLHSTYSDEQADTCDPDILPSQYLEQIYHQPNEASKNKRQTKKKKPKETVSTEMKSILEECQPPRQTKKKESKGTISNEMISILGQRPFPKIIKRKKSQEKISDETISILEECQSPEQAKKKKSQEKISDEMKSILEECQSPEKKREKISSLLSESINESPEDGKSSDTSSPITIIYLKP